MKKTDKEKTRRSLTESQGGSSAISKLNNERAGGGESKRIGFDLNYLFSALLTALVALMSAGMVLYFGYHLVNTFTSDVTAAPAYEITENEYRRAQGYIFRSEEPVISYQQGTPDYRVEDASRLAVDDLICDIYTSIAEDVRTEIALIDREIELLEASIDPGVITSGLPEAIVEAKDEYRSIMNLLAEGRYSDAAAAADAFRAALNRVEWLDGNTEDFKKILSELLARRSALLASYGRKIGSANADTVGYFFKNTDGYEEIFLPSLLSDISMGGFAQLIESEPADVSMNVGKMIYDSKWYICIPLGADSAKGFAEGERYNIIFNDNAGLSISMLLERLVLDLDDHDADGDRAEALLVFSTREMPKGFSYYRIQDVSIEFAAHKGYRIPISALRYYDGMTGVYVLNGGYVFFRRVEVIYEGNGYFIAADYSDAEPGRPLTYTTLGFSDFGKFDDYASLHATAQANGWEKENHDNGGIPIPKGLTLKYFYHLGDLEQVILTGRDLYHGKVLD